MNDLVCNLHIHSTYSDGTGSYDEILKAAAAAGVDVVIITDHNIHVDGIEGYYQKAGKHILLLSGEEVHDQGRFPQNNHLLVFGAESEVAQSAYDPQLLIDLVNERGGFAFIAHPDEFDLPLFNEDDISWINWKVSGFSGFELWNGMSEFKTVSRTLPQIVKHAFFPELVAHNPLQKTLERWDSYLSKGYQLSVVGGTDSHALRIRIGPFTKIVFPYKFHFSTLNNHLQLQQELTGKYEVDKKLVLDAIKNGTSFIGYDLPASTRGFAFRIDTDEGVGNLGGGVSMQRSAIVHVKMPLSAEMRLIHNGEVIFQSEKINHLSYPVAQPGAYRVECYIRFLGEKRGWIFSNPIYLNKA